MLPAGESGTLTDMSWGRSTRGVRAPLSPRAERREDVLLAGIVGLGGLVEIALGAVPGHVVLASLSVVVMAGALTLRRVRPRTVLAVVLTAFAVQSLLGVPVNAQVMTLPPIIVAAYSVGAHLDRRRSAAGLAIGALLAGVAVAAAGASGSDYGFGLFLVTTPWIAGVLVRARGAAESEAVATAENRARRAADDERQRIARELHDIVSHGLSAMVVQAAAAAELVDHSPDAARAAMRAVQTTGVDAMTEMRHMLGLLRGAEATGRQPQPDLQDVHELVAAEQAAGRRVGLTVRGEPRVLPRGMALSVFRIVQESLTNARKHADGGRCEVTIAYGRASLEVEIVDDGGGRPASTPGFGIIGMRERARLYGGTLDAAPLPRGGWSVRASFPLEHLVG